MGAKDDTDGSNSNINRRDDGMARDRSTMKKETDCCCLLVEKL